MSEPETGDTGFDLDASVATIAGGLGLNAVEDEPVAADENETGEAVLDQTPAKVVATPEITARPPPKSWAKEKHELWGKLPPDAQEYYETREKQFLDGLEQYKGDAGFAKQLRDVITPYKATIAAQGLNESQAVQYLLNAHYRLSTGSPEERAAAYRQIGEDLGLVQAALDPNATIDPVLKQVQDELREVKSTLTAEQQAKQAQRRAECDAETEKFASDPANVYFSEVAPDMVLFVKEGLSLKEAYDKAVWANPVVRQKEIARIQTEDAAKLKEKSKNEAEAARKAASTNVRGSETRRAPTEPKGTMDDTMRDTLKKIKERAH